MEMLVESSPTSSGMKTTEAKPKTLIPLQARSRVPVVTEEEEEELWEEEKKKDEEKDERPQITTRRSELSRVASGGWREAKRAPPPRCN